jgi:hypothetical protein
MRADTGCLPTSRPRGSPVSGWVDEQLTPERARSRRNAITMASMMLDEIRLRAHARPLDEPGQ